ncbi:U3 small nucleolar RNA-associated protein 13 [Fistulifera solaris]|uniref:U3 small nucleolar RNA-associated protein 13 n=1 Tax=Fistulifera solaris TaxID=1519565 RepID=A0A1Z5J9L8_FISSO|nr:U3 small nucleolar RNA-associated protein 13 [Fistulifera solaris]|eukprot:GAX10687.1 U3 small nucleolar RNA-associated protein 13 [Fistulifera solaris]
MASSDSESSTSSSSSSEEPEERNDLTSEEMSTSSSDDEARKEESGMPHDTQQQSAPTLSKSWSVRTAHTPIYTGGKIALGKSRLSLDDNLVPFLLLPVNGDLVLVDATRGIRLDSVRGENANDFNDDDDDDEGMDADAVTAFGLAGNDKMIVTCSHNSILRQYSLHNNGSSRLIQLQKTWGKSGHTLPVTAMEFHRSNIFLATASVDGSVRIWDVRGGTPFVTHSFRPLAAGYEGGGSGTLSVSAIQWKDDVSTLSIAIARDDGSIAIHNLRNADDVVVLRDHVAAVNCMNWVQGGSFFVSTGRDAVINLWRVQEVKSKKKKQADAGASFAYERVHTLPVYEQVEGMVIIPNSNPEGQDLLLATAGEKGRIRLWKADLSSSDPRLALLSKQHENSMFGEKRGGYTNLLYDAYGVLSDKSSHQFVTMQQLLATDAEHNLLFLSMHKEDYPLETQRTIVGHNDEILDLKVIPSTSGDAPTRIIVATNSAQARIFDLNTFSCDVLDRHTAVVLCVDASPCGQYLATCGKDKQVRIWHTERQKSVAIATGHTEAVGAVAFSQKLGRYQVRGKAADNGGGAFIVSVSADKTLKRWNLPGSSDLNELAFNEDEATLHAFLSTRAHDKDINTVSVAPNDSYIATGSQDKTAKIWRSTDLSLVATLKGHRRGVWECQFSPYDRVIATASGDKTIKLWSLGDFSCVRTFQGHVASVLRVRFLSGGLQLVSSGADGLLKLWTIRTNECEATLSRHNDKVWALDLLSNGKTLVSGGADSNLVIWDDTTKDVIRAKMAEEKEAILLDQKLANHMRQNEFKEALYISLDRDKPHHALRILTTVIEQDLSKGNSCINLLKGIVAEWNSEHLKRVIGYCREWNTLARNSLVALTTLRAIVTIVRADSLAAMDDVPETLAGIQPYAERHFDRVDRLFANSYLLDFVLYSMGSVDDDKKDEYLVWESSSRLVTPPKYTDGRMQIGGKTVITGTLLADPDDGGSDNDVVTIGESSESGSDDSSIEAD